MNRVVVVGASAGGIATAEALRRVGHRDPITVIGNEFRVPYDRPPLSKQLLSGQWEVDRVELRRPRALDALDLDVRLGVAATELDAVRQTVGLSDGSEVQFGDLVVATGVRPRWLAATQGLLGAHVIRTLDDALGLRARLQPGRRLVVVGGGFVGAEVAATASACGVQVTVLEAGSSPMGAVVGEEVGRILAAAHRRHGVTVRTGVKVRDIVSAGGAVMGVRLSDRTYIPADDVLMAIGSTPNVEWLTSSGLNVGNGLECDEYSCAAAHVHGVGDVASWYNPLFESVMRVEHRTNASEQALAVARNIVAPWNRRPFAPVPYFWSDQYEMKIAAYGLLRGHDEAVLVHRYPESTRLLAAYRTGDRLTGVLSIGMPPKVLRYWRHLVAGRTPWTTAVVHEADISRTATETPRAETYITSGGSR